MQRADEVVDVVGPVAAGVQLLGQGEERLWVVGEVVNVENGLRIRDVIPLQVRIQACGWGSGGGTEQTLVYIVCCWFGEEFNQRTTKICGEPYCGVV